MAPGLAELCLETILNFSWSLAAWAKFPILLEPWLDIDIKEDSIMFCLGLPWFISANKVRASIGSRNKLNTRWRTVSKTYFSTSVTLLMVHKGRITRVRKNNIGLLLGKPHLVVKFVLKVWLTYTFVFSHAVHNCVKFIVLRCSHDTC